MLRTVTFSNPQVAAVVNKHFVSAWYNRSPGFTNNDYATEISIFKNSAEAYTTQNICTFVLSPDGRVFNYVAGYLSPELFMQFLRDSLSMRTMAFDRTMKPKVGALGIIRAFHAGKSAKYQKDIKAAAESCSFVEREYREVKHTHSDRCKWVRQSAYGYFVRLHTSLGQVKALPTLEEIRYKYLYGNMFTEEGAGASKIARDPSLMIFR